MALKVNTIGLVTEFIKYTSKEGKERIKATVAFNSKDSKGEQEPTYWVEATAFGSAMNDIEQNFKKGLKLMKMFVSISTNKSEDNVYTNMQILKAEPYTKG